MKTYILLLGSSFLLSLLFTPAVRALAHRFGWLDRPGERRVHKVATPRLGGVAIALAFVLALLPLLLIHNSITLHLRIQWPILEPLPAAILVIFLLGLVDDLFGVGPYVKLAVEVACSLWVFYHGIYIGLVANPVAKAFDLGIWSMPLTVLWLVGLTNAFNLVDGIDGLAAGIALFGMAALVVASLLTGSVLLITVLMALGGATAGFLVFNFHPASIFLGDSGSLFLGFTLGALSLVWGQKSSLAVAVVGPILIFALPIADAGLAIVRRFFTGAPIFTADSDHIHHRLLQLGLSPRKAVLVLYAACFLFGLLTLSIVNFQAGVALFVLILLPVGSWLVFSRLGYHELAEINLILRRGVLDQRRIIGQRVRLRKGSEAVGEAADVVELWARIVDVAQAFKFDHVDLLLNKQWLGELSVPLDSSSDWSPPKPYWKDGARSAYSEHPERFWKIEIPLSTGSGEQGRVVFCRTVGGEELHLVIEPFVQLVSAAISKGLANLERESGKAPHRKAAAVSSAS